MVAIEKEIRRSAPAGVTDEQLQAELSEAIRTGQATPPAAKQEVLDTMRKDQALAQGKGEWTVRDLAQQLDIPPGFILTINGRPYVTKEGLLAQARRIGFDSIQATIHEDGKGGYEAEAQVVRSLRPDELALLQAMALKTDHDTFRLVYKDLHAPTVAHASATKENVRNPGMAPWMRELAETRAINRALRLFTGCGLVSVDELEDAGRHGILAGASS